LLRGPKIAMLAGVVLRTPGKQAVELPLDVLRQALPELSGGQ
jgi:hypothetical protein